MTNKRNIYVIGAGMAGLSASLQLALAGESVALYEASPFAGGRCRSFYDRELDCRIDNGNHLVLSGNAILHDYLFLTGALDTMGGPDEPVFPFFDLESGERWTVKMNEGLIPWWILNKNRRVQGTRIRDYFSAFKILAARGNDRAADLLDTGSMLYRCFWEPLITGVLNTEPEIASADLLSRVLVQSFAAGGRACIPLIPKTGLSESFVQPCLDVLLKHGVEVKYGHRLRMIEKAANESGKERSTARAIHFHNGVIIDLAPEDWVIMALPAWTVREILPEIPTPDDFRSIINAHYRIDGVSEPVGFVGLVGGLAEWVFVRNGILSATVSCAERYGNYPVRDMAFYIWQDIAQLYGLDPERVPPHRIFKEKYATFAATPEQNRQRPTSWTGWKNLALAGEWTATSLPSTIEGALRSGLKAAQVVLRWS